MRSKFEILSNGLVENHCPCRDNQERGLICCHLVAMGLSLLSKNNDKKVNGRVDRIAKSAKGIRVRRARKSTPGAIHAELLLEISENTEFAVIEMGANHIGEIELLSKIAEPNYGYITNFGKAHLEGFGSEEGVIKGKSEFEVK